MVYKLHVHICSHVMQEETVAYMYEAFVNASSKWRQACVLGYVTTFFFYKQSCPRGI